MSIRNVSYITNINDIENERIDEIKISKEKNL